MKMYQYFKAKFLNRLQQFGQDKMNVKVQELRKLREKAVKECGIEKVTLKQIMNDYNDISMDFGMPFKRDVYGFRAPVNKSHPDCKMMISSELNMVSLVRKEQLKRWNKTMESSKIASNHSNPGQ